MENYDYDLFVIGAGSGGVRAARVSASLGAKVAVAEERYLGGTCVNVGCVPKKLFVYGSHFAEDFEDAEAYGWQAGDPKFHWPTLRDNKSREIERLNGVYEGLLTDAGVEILAERAVLTGPHSIRAGNTSIKARNILVATGSWPVVPPFPGSDLAVTSNEAFYLPEFPRRALIIGGGYIAVEFAGIFAGLGAEVTLAYRGELFLRGFDAGIRRFVLEEMATKGVDVRLNTRIASVERVGDRLHCRFDDATRLDVDLVMAATGRAPASADLGFEAAGVVTAANGAIPVDDSYRTNVPHVYAIGDVIDRLQLTPVAIAEGMCVAHNLFAGGSRQVDYANVPTAIFCQPNIGTVGPTEERAREIYPELAVYESSFKPMKHTVSGRGERTLMKLLVNAEDDRVVAAHMCGPEAGEIIQGLSVAIKAGATKADFDSTIGIHPTAAEEFVTMREAAR
ncbi:MAG: glutathione-disulfide reductase [Gammaproteobacteria bacterium]|nr:glutathione-disulfide reductase [Gammaproteobacteria bacterium]